MQAEAGNDSSRTMRRNALALKRLARESGFDLVRLSAATRMDAERARYLSWIEEGRQAGMRWITREQVERSSDPAEVLPTVQTVISVGLAYWAGNRARPGTTTGRIARYAWGDDYHAVLGEQLHQLQEKLSDRMGGEHRWLVDTGPAMDKAHAARSGLGWYGKNTNILTEKFGSYVLLGEIFTSLPAAPDQPLTRDCGSCSLCVRACPTGALGPDYQIDSRKCISYFTIEHRGAIPLEYRQAIGDWVFGCDICQDVCPPNSTLTITSDGDRRAWAVDVRAQLHGKQPRLTWSRGVLQPHQNALHQRQLRADINLRWLLRLQHDEYLRAFRGTSVRRAKVWMLRRNAAIALGNVGGANCAPDLTRALREDDHPLVRGHAAWAIGRLTTRIKEEALVTVLLAAATAEGDATVQLEIADALAACGTSPARET